MILATTFLFFFALIAIPFAVARWIPAAHAIGDESEYLEKGRSGDLFASHHFLRPPLLAFLSSLCHRWAKDQERALRVLVVLVSALTVLATLTTGHLMGGPALGLLAATLLLLHPERIALSNRIWPDPFLGLILSLCHLVLASNPPFEVLILGLLGTAATAIRIDGIFVAPLSWLALCVLDRPPDPNACGVLLLPPLALLLVLSWWNYRRRGIFLPDDTVIFNLLLTFAETRPRPGLGRNQIIVQTWNSWSALQPAGRLELLKQSAGNALRRPLHLIKAMGSRTLQLVSRDTFCRDFVLPGAPRWGSSRVLWWLDRSLRVFTPVLFLFTLVASVLSKTLPSAALIPALAIVIPALLFHFRTRYRVAILPAFCLFSAQAFTALSPDFWEVEPWQGTALLSILTLAAIAHRIGVPDELPRVEG